jgi:hypothetical protein
MSVVQLMVLKPLLLPLLVDLLVRLGQLNLRMALMIRLLYMMGRLLDQQVLKSDKLAYYYLCDMDPDEGRKLGLEGMGARTLTRTLLLVVLGPPLLPLLLLIALSLPLVNLQWVLPL